MQRFATRIYSFSQYATGGGFILHTVRLFPPRIAGGGSFTIKLLNQYVLPNPPTSHPMVAILRCYVYNLCKEKIMKKQLESQLNCQATASLREEVMKEMAQEDRPLKELLDESEDNEKDSN